MALRDEFKAILFEFATEAKNADEFEAKIREFFDETNAPAEADWLAAVIEVRAGRVQSPGLPEQPAESPRGVTVEQKDHFAPSGNQIEPSAAMAA
jgi:hypothetical protein